MQAPKALLKIQFTHEEFVIATPETANQYIQDTTDAITGLTVFSRDFSDNISLVVEDYLDPTTPEMPLDALLAYSKLDTVPELGWEQFRKFEQSWFPNGIDKHQAIKETVRFRIPKSLEDVLLNHVDEAYNAIASDHPFVEVDGHWFNESLI